MDRKLVSVVVGFFVLSSITQAGAAPKTAGAKTGSEATAKAGRLEPWEPVDPAFNGCSEGVCGRRGRDARGHAARAGEDQPRAGGHRRASRRLSRASQRVRDDRSRRSRARRTVPATRGAHRAGRRRTAGRRARDSRGARDGRGDRLPGPRGPPDQAPSDARPRISPKTDRV